MRVALVLFYMHFIKSELWYCKDINKFNDLNHSFQGFFQFYSTVHFKNESG